MGEPCSDPYFDLYLDLCDDDEGDKQPLLKAKNNVTEQKTNQLDLAPVTGKNQFKAMNENQKENLQRPISEEEKNFILQNQPHILIQKFV